MIQQEQQKRRGKNGCHIFSVAKTFYPIVSKLSKIWVGDPGTG
jgi:hypothetical protein